MSPETQWALFALAAIGGAVVVSMVKDLHVRIRRLEQQLRNSRERDNRDALLEHHAAIEGQCAGRN